MPTLAHMAKSFGLVRPQMDGAFGLEHGPHGSTDPVGPGLHDGVAGRHVLDVGDAVAVPAQQVGWVHLPSLPE